MSSWLESSTGWLCGRFPTVLALNARVLFLSNILLYNIDGKVGVSLAIMVQGYMTLSTRTTGGPTAKMGMVTMLVIGAKGWNCKKYQVCTCTCDLPIESLSSEIVVW